MIQRVLAALAVGSVAAALPFLIGGNEPASVQPVDALFAEWDRPGSPGCALGVSRNGDIVYERGYGMASVELNVPITPTSVFPIASISKQFTAFSILLLAQRGQLSLDDEARKYITELPRYDAPITIRHLLTHTSGLRDGFNLDGWSAPRQDNSDPNDAIVRVVARQRGLNFLPGTQFQYNNGGYNLLAHIVKRVTGQPLATFAADNIFTPLGMAGSHFHDDPAMIVPRRVTGYWRDARGLQIGSEAPGIIGNAGMHSTVGDLLRWERNLAAPTVGDRRLVAEMQTSTTLTGGGTNAYGYGLSSSQYRGARIVEHGGGDRGIAAYFIRFPDHGLAITVLCNGDFIPAGLLAQRVADVYLADRLAALTPASVPPVAVTVAADELRDDSGWYRARGKDGVLRAFTRDGKLLLTDYEGAGDEYELTPVGEQQFALIFGGTVANRIEFFRSQGRVAQLRIVSADPSDKGELLDRLTDIRLTPAAMEAYAGLYHSDELDVVYAVGLEDGRLALRAPGRSVMLVEPVAEDLFSGPIAGTVNFSRDRSGALTGFTMTRTLARNVRFERVN